MSDRGLQVQEILDGLRDLGMTSPLVHRFISAIFHGCPVESAVVAAIRTADGIINHQSERLLAMAQRSTYPPSVILADGESKAVMG